jgi:hypothetical protein
MKFLIALVVGFAAACMLAPSEASAQASRTWVSGTGDDANPCSRTAPCKTFAGAISKTAAAGEINCIDTGGYGALTITKSIAIKCDNTEAGVLVAGTNGFVVSAASTDVVYVSGIDFEGLGAASNSLNGIKFNTGGVLTVENCIIRGFGNTNGTDGNGIFFAPTAGTPKLFVDNTVIADNQNVGIEVKPGSGAGANAKIKNVRVSNGTTGFRANGTGGATSVNIDIMDSAAIFSSGVGVRVLSTGQSVQAMVNHSNISFNGTGLAADGSANGIIRVGYSTITGNVTATSGTNSGQVLSYGNNQLNGNTNELPLPGPVQLH